MLRGSRNTRFSRRSRLSSSRSVVVKPSRRRPSSSAACLTHLRITLADGSNSRANWLMLRPARASSIIRRRYSGAYGGWVDGIGKSPVLSFPTPSTKPGQLQPTYCPQANPIERAFGDVHDKCTRNHQRKRLWTLVRDVTRHLAVNGPWHYQLSKIYYTPEVTAAVQALAATSTSQRECSQLAA